MSQTPIQPLPEVETWPTRKTPQERYDTEVQAAMNRMAAMTSALNKDFIPKTNAAAANVSVVLPHLDSVDAVAASIDAVNAVLPHVANVDTVAANIANVNTVATDMKTVNAVGTAIGDVTIVAGGIADVSAVAPHAANIDTVAGSIDAVNAVAPLAANIDTVAANIANVNTVAPHVANVDTVAANIANVNTVATDMETVNTVGTAIADVNAVADSLADVTTVLPHLANVDTVAANIANVNSAADNMALIQAAPDHAKTASDKATEAATSAWGAASSATNAAASETHTAAMEAHVENMRDGLMQGATPEPTPETPMRRDGSGRSQVEAPEQDKDIANRAWTLGEMESAVAAHALLTDAHGATSEPEPGAIALRDDFGRIKAEAPEADKDAANKGYVDTGLADAANDLSSHVASTAAHGAATAATANSIAMRTTGGRLSVGAPSATNHAATKAYVDSEIANITNPGIAKAWAATSYINGGNLYGHNVVSLVSDQNNQHTITFKPGVFSDATKMAAVAFANSGEVYIGSLTTSAVFMQTLNSSGNHALKKFTVIVFEGK